MIIQLDCVVCGQIKFSKSVLCGFCLKKISSLKIKKRSLLGVDHYSLFTWTEEVDTFIKPLIYFLKGRETDCFKDLAKFFKDLDLEGEISLICPPSSMKRQYNHAESFAKALSKLFKTLSVIPLEARKAHSTPQKLLKREERLKAKRGLKALKPLKQDHLDWVFVDDVLVSGSTLQSLIEIYGLPRAALTLVYRPVFGEEEREETEEDEKDRENEEDDDVGDGDDEINK